MGIIALDTLKVIRENTGEGSINIQGLVEGINTSGNGIMIDPIPEDTIAARTFVEELNEWCNGRNITWISNSILAGYLSQKYRVELTTPIVPIAGKPNPRLQQYGACLTDMRLQNDPPIVVDRKDVIDTCIRAMCRSNRKSPIIVGNPGTGRTSIVYGLARKIMNYDVPTQLVGKNIYRIDPQKIVENIVHIGDLEQRIREITRIADRMGHIIFIDDLERASTRNPVSPYTILDLIGQDLLNSNMILIGTTTHEGWRAAIENNSTLLNSVEKVVLDEPTTEEATEIAMHAKAALEKHHSVIIPDTIVPEALRITLSTKHNWPASVLELLDTSAVEAKMRVEQLPTPNPTTEAWWRKVQRGELIQASAEIPRIGHYSGPTPVLTTHDLDAAAARDTGTHMDSEGALRTLEEELRKVIVNQNEAIGTLCQLVRTAHIFRRPDRPVASMIFLGSPGCGKTYTAEVLADIMYEGKILKLNMSEYSERFTVSRLIGSPPGYVGYDEGGTLTEWARRNPVSVVLLDEIEKAHPDIYDIFLSITDRGTVTDMLGRDASFSGIVLIMTSNIGTRRITDNGKYELGFGRKVIDTDELIMKDVRKTLKPEFIDRLSGIVTFNTLCRDDVARIVDLELGKINEDTSGPPVSMSREARNILLHDWEEGDGARAIGRLLTTLVLEPISARIIDGKLPRDSGILVYASDGQLRFRRG